MDFTAPPAELAPASRPVRLGRSPAAPARADRAAPVVAAPAGACGRWPTPAEVDAELATVPEPSDRSPRCSR